jgi:hypothetical protein
MFLGPRLKAALPRLQSGSEYTGTGWCADSLIVCEALLSTFNNNWAQWRAFFQKTKKGFCGAGHGTISDSRAKLKRVTN